MGQPVDGSQLDVIGANIVATLDIGETDRVLDLGCGNGLVTHLVSGFAGHVTGADVSQGLLAAARTSFAGPRCDYVLCNLPQIDGIPGLEGIAKVYCYEVLQYLTPEEVGVLLVGLRGSCAPSVRVFLGSLPDAERIRRFYDTRERWERYQALKEEKQEQIGHWWSVRELAELAAASGFSCEIRPQPESLYTAHYRFDALLRAT